MSLLPNHSKADLTHGYIGLLPEIYLWTLSGLIITVLLAYGITTVLAWLVNPVERIFLHLISFALQIIYGLDLTRRIQFEGVKPVKAGAKFFFFFNCLINACTFSFVYELFNLNFILSFLGLNAFMFAGVASYGFWAKGELSKRIIFLMASFWSGFFLLVFQAYFYNNSFSTVVFCIGALIIAVLTARDVQKIRCFKVNREEGGQVNTNNAVFAALMLHVDLMMCYVWFRDLFDKYYFASLSWTHWPDLPPGRWHTIKD
ncbi:Bax inhibitor-1 family protein [Vampirovibrio chlorellavorus]|uniref:Bax inhibitor-1 family protein n=1 Tax=Vampirovibrio chlorellavorus TaxID=758823 RepID=UPI0026EE8FCB|nr:Bax inhibitor-1 family protein [Vampirovibrio chlorellavorus]